jgi:Tfp pilus assembly protein PilX
MSNLNKNQQGFGHTLVLLLLVVLSGVGLVGYRVVNKNRKVAVSPTAVVNVVKSASKIANKNDVIQVSKALDSDPGTTQLDTAQLEADLANIL